MALYPKPAAGSWTEHDPHVGILDRVAAPLP
jgi:hypothetical protein